MFRRPRPSLGVFLLAAFAPLLGCRAYHITQFDNVAVESFRPVDYHRAAILTHKGGIAAGLAVAAQTDRNKLFLEAFQVQLMKRGFDVVEREKFAKLVDEQLLVRGEMTDLSDREKAMRLGKMMNVDVVFYADALVNQSRYAYDPRFLLSTGSQAFLQEQKTRESGVVEGVGKFTIHAYHDVGVSVRVIDARTGEIVWVGYRMLAACEEVTKHSPTALTNFATIKQLCAAILDDFYAPLTRLQGRKDG